MPVLPINSYEEFKTIIAGDDPVLIDFWASWCGPCKAISPVLEKMSDESKSKVKFYKVNIDDVPNIAEEVQIRVVPTFLVFKNGSKSQELAGADPKALQVSPCL
ncbi:thioredoxin [Phlegmacium glaucopus]|nr:thioredoxin [Phlegmacium glaucopus]